MMARVCDTANSSAYRGNMFRWSCVHRLSLTQDPAGSLRDIRRRPNPKPLKAHRYLVLNVSIYFVVRVSSTEQCDSLPCKGLVVGWTAWIQFLITTKNSIPSAACRTILQGNQFSTVVGNIARWEGGSIGTRRAESQACGISKSTFHFLRTPQCVVGRTYGRRIRPDLASTQFHTD